MFLVGAGGSTQEQPKVTDVFDSGVAITSSNIPTPVNIRPSGFDGFALGTGSAGETSHVVYFKNLFVRVQTRYVDTSPDGLNWTRIRDIQTDDFLLAVNSSLICCSDDYLMIVARHNTTPAHIVLRTSDLSSWDVLTNPGLPAYTFQGLQYSSGYFFVLLNQGDTNNPIYKCAESGDSWSLMGTITSSTGNLRCFKAANTRIFCSTSAACYSIPAIASDLSTMTTITTTGSNYFNDVVWDAARSRYAAVLNNTNFSTSATGTSFSTVSTLPAICAAIILVGSYTVVFDVANRRCIYSTNQIDWTYGTECFSSAPTARDLSKRISTDGNIVVVNAAVDGFPIVLDPNFVSTQGGMIWLKDINDADSSTLPYMFDTVRGGFNALQPNTTSAQASSTIVTGFSQSSVLGVSQSNFEAKYCIFKESPNFFKIEKVSHTTGTATVVSLSSLSTVGMVFVKRTDSTSDWWVWHRSLSAGSNLRLHTTAAVSSGSAWLSVSGTNLTISSSMPSGVYLVYAWAHDTATTSFIQCGSYTGTHNTPITVNLGWQPQYVLVKKITDTGPWYTFDTSINVGYGGGAYCEMTTNSGFQKNIRSDIKITPTGFTLESTTWNANSHTYVYMVIRDPNLPVPELVSGLWVTGIKYTNTSTSANRNIYLGLQPDVVLTKIRTAPFSYAGWVLHTRLLGTAMFQWVGNEDIGGGNYMWYTKWGIHLQRDSIANEDNCDYIVYAIQRYKYLFDVVMYDGNGTNRTIPHNLGSAPTMMWIANRDASAAMVCYFGDPTKTLLLNSDALPVTSATTWNNTAPTDTEISLGTDSAVNSSGNKFIAYLFADYPGRIKTGTYISTGTSGAVNIDCGFTGTARIVIIKRISPSTGGWYIWDVYRGIVDGGEYFLLLNSTNTESGPLDWIDPYAGGFSIPAANIPPNQNGGNTYFYIAFA